MTHSGQKTDVPQSQEKTYTAFVSYSHSDMAAARWLQRRLEGFKLPPELIGTQTDVGIVPATLKPVFRDADEFSAGPSVSASIREALEASRTLVVVCSPASKKSAWVDDEVKHFIEMGRADRIFALLVDGDPAGAPEECFPASLLTSLDGDMPLAADIRKGGLGEGKVKALSKIVAGITGLPLDTLIQREQRATQRRLFMRLGAAVGLSIATIAAVLFFTLFQLEEEKADRRLFASKENLDLQLERIEAFQNDINATEAHIRLTMEGAQSEISRFSDEVSNDPDIRISEARLYKIFGDLEARFGNIQAQRKVLEKARDILISVPWDYPHEDFHELVLEVDMGLAGVLELLGEGEEALLLSQRTHDRVLDLLIQEPSNKDLLKYKIRTASNIGSYHEQRASIVEARKWFALGRSHDEDVQTMDLDDAELAIEVARSYRRLGNAEIQLGQPEKAAEAYQRAMSKSDAVLAMQKQVYTRPAIRALAYAQLRQGYLEASQGRTLEAGSWLTNSLATFDKALTLDPRDREALKGKAVNLTYLAEISISNKEWSSSIDLHARALAIFEDIGKADYLNEFNHLQRARTLINLGRAHSELADQSSTDRERLLDIANINYSSSEELLNALLATDPDNISKSLELGRIIYGRALILYRQGSDGMKGKLVEAWKEMDRALSLRKKILARDPSNELKAQDVDYAERWKAFIAEACGRECTGP